MLLQLALKISCPKINNKTMKMPNLRYGDRDEFVFYADGRPPKTLARMLRRSERSVKDWLDGKSKIPWWVPELMRLRQMEARDRHRQMFLADLPRRLAVVSGDVIQFPTLKDSKNENQAPIIHRPGPDPDGMLVNEAG
ncbi:hypothetical protein HFRIS_004903 [Herbaspirillum frisingense GSF30]|uniref:Uncharacterized protein n=1 Tax=Herbaspirillum frisingense GSF30 TaxID=864073 RepID=A0AAI9N4W9_9BURK|nr:hypothetical protein [Herbaspirillum frisingense]EOA05769.1 hypothetical protein HFRIS_004903 [Herbaspirillum frisingense GSF30]